MPSNTRETSQPTPAKSSRCVGDCAVALKFDRGPHLGEKQYCLAHVAGVHEYAVATWAVVQRAMRALGSYKRMLR